MIAGVGLAIALAAIGTITTADRSDAPLLRFLYSAICFSSPLILVARAVYGRWAPWLVRVAIVVALLAVLSRALPIANDETGIALVMAALLALLLHPRVRAMGPLALGFFSIVIVGSAVSTVSALFLWIAELRADPQTAAIMESIRNMEPAQRAGALVSIGQEYLPRMIGVAAVGAAAGLLFSVLLGGLLLRLVTTSYTRKRTSDQWLIIASVWLFFVGRRRFFARRFGGESGVRSCIRFRCQVHVVATPATREPVFAPLAVALLFARRAQQPAIPGIRDSVERRR